MDTDAGQKTATVTPLSIVVMVVGVLAFLALIPLAYPAIVVGLALVAIGLLLRRDALGPTGRQLVMALGIVLTLAATVYALVLVPAHSGDGSTPPSEVTVLPSSSQPVTG